MARTVAAAHAKLTLKADALAAAEKSLAKETNTRERIQTQLENFVAKHASIVEDLDSQLASTKARELELSNKLLEANQRVRLLYLAYICTDILFR